MNPSSRQRAETDPPAASAAGGLAAAVGPVGSPAPAAPRAPERERAEAVIEVCDVHKHFGKSHILKGIDVRVRHGECVFIIGPSGSGKSTLLRCLNRLEEPSGGTIFFNGRNILAGGTDIRAIRRQIGMVFQHFNLYPHMSALGNVTLALRYALGKPKKEAAAIGLQALERVGLADKAASYPAQLSGGQQQRVAIARALALGPSVMLYDEPTSALDPELVGSVLRVMREMRDQGMTMIVVSHEMRFAREAADRVVFMDGGRIVEQGPPEEVFLKPTHERTRAFLSQISF